MGLHCLVSPVGMPARVLLACHQSQQELFGLKSRWERPVRRGFTLVEIIIVLGIIVIIGGLVLTAIQKPMAGRRLQLAADQIRVEWARARSRAMASGRIYCFICEVGGSGYAVQPWSDAGIESAGLTEADQSLPPLDSGSAAGSSLLGSQSGNMGLDTVITGRKELPEKITFADIQVMDSNLSATFSEDVTGLGADASVMGALGTGTPTGGTASGTTIFFFPDGSTSSALLTLQNEYGRRIDISLRGLTGSVLVGDPYNGEHEEGTTLVGQQGSLP
ncbi:prepilin-type N-terminal cleavage/methylation domain-containing protein [Thermogutta sp.]|uniref:prepilin-type N-terminal cleavage/methylation domain-containing protein n=1 Tax=Thermogutta sp. TaxID=1962930 RepID=UPI003C7B2B78